MTGLTQERLSAVMGRTILWMSLAWAATMIAAAVVSKASGDFIWLLLVLILGFSLSSAVLESTRRALVIPPTP